MDVAPVGQLAWPRVISCGSEVKWEHAVLGPEAVTADRGADQGAYEQSDRNAKERQRGPDHGRGGKVWWDRCMESG